MGGGKEWLILDAGSLSGTFDGAISDLAFLYPQLRYDNQNADVFLYFASIDRFVDQGTTSNQRAVAQAIQNLPSGSSLHTLVLGNATHENVGEVLNSLSGEIHASLSAGLRAVTSVVHRDLLRHAALQARAESRPTAVSAGENDSWSNRLWVSIGASYEVLDATADSARTTFKGSEFSGGYDFSLANGFLGGLVLHFADKKLEADRRLSKIDLKSLGLSAYLGKSTELGSGSLSFILGGGYAWHNLEGERRVVIGANTQTLTSSYDASSWQVFLETSYVFQVGAASSLEPFVTFGWMGMQIDGFSERGGNAALVVSPESYTNGFSHLGLRLSVPFGERFSLSSELGWKRIYGRLENEKTIAFQEGGYGFPVRGVSPNRNELTFGLRGNLAMSENTTFSLTYEGAYGGRGRTHGGSGTFTFTW
jgi:uncharacterized protein with beta-barrel porin domain